MNAAMLHTALALLSGALALLLCHRAMPRLHSARGRWHAICVSVLALALMVSVPFLLALAAAEAPVSWPLALHFALVQLYAACRLRHALQLSDSTWSRDGAGCRV